MLVVVEHPFCEQCTTAADDSGEAIFEQREVFFQYSCVECEEVDALSGLLFNCAADCFCVDVLDASSFDDLIDWYSAERDGAVGEEFFASPVEVLSGA